MRPTTPQRTPRSHAGQPNKWTKWARNTEAVRIGRKSRGSPIRSGASASAFSKAERKDGRRVHGQAWCVPSSSSAAAPRLVATWTVTWQSELLPPII